MINKIWRYKHITLTRVFLKKLDQKKKKNTLIKCMNLLNSFRKRVNKETKIWKTNHLRRTKCTFEDIEFQERRTFLCSLLYCFVLFFSYIFFRNYMEKNIPQSNAWTFWIIYRENQQKKWKYENKLFEKKKMYLWGYCLSREKNLSLLFFVLFCSFLLPFLFWIWKVFLLSFIKGNLI